MTLHEAYYAACGADAAWHGELVRIYGKRAGDVRYTKAGRGKSGTLLRDLFTAWSASRDSWHRECDKTRLYPNGAP